ncbi:MAG: type II secretion system GspH family protein [Candidatus Doudnabacteria bacterium]|nr:type II secretion system GspH family protein [Candidatus Doudnabacteria bacterium]
MRTIHNFGKNQGFTLIELLVVVAIIGLLLSLIMVSFGYSQAKARDSKRISDMKQIKTGLELYYSTGQGYPDESVFNLAQNSSSMLSCAGIDVIRVPDDRIGTFSYDYTSAGASVTGCGGTVWSDYKVRFQTEYDTELGPPGFYYIGPRGFTNCDPFVC